MPVMAEVEHVVWCAAPWSMASSEKALMPALLGSCPATGQLGAAVATLRRYFPGVVRPPAGLTVAHLLQYKAMAVVCDPLGPFSIESNFDVAIATPAGLYSVNTVVKL